MQTPTQLRQLLIQAALQQRMNGKGKGTAHSGDFGVPAEDDIADNPDGILAGDDRGHGRAGVPNDHEQLGDSWGARPGSGEFGSPDLNDLLDTIHGGGDQSEGGILGGLMGGLYPGGSQLNRTNASGRMGLLGSPIGQALVGLLMNRGR